MNLASAYPVKQKMMMPTTQGLVTGHSRRPKLAQLAMLMAANIDVAERVLDDPIGAAAAHPYYPLSFDAQDCAVLEAIRTQATTIDEFLAGLADVVDGACS